MKKSIWFQEYEKEVQGKRKKSNQGKKVALFVPPVMLVLAMVAALANGGATDPQARTGMLCMLGVFAFIMVFTMIMLSVGKKIDAAKGTRENILGLLQNDDEVDRFDQQMKSAPLMEEKISTDTTVFLTADYVGMRFLNLGDLQYRFAHRNDIAALDFSKTASAGANPLKASYFFDVKNANNEKLLGGMAETRDRLEKLEALLKVVQPGLIVTKKGII